MMPKELYERLNRAFDAVRLAEREASRLERQAEEERDRAYHEVRALYDMLNDAAVSLKVPK